ncbi:MAG: hypothetical protein RLZZ175_321 [Bacteroidota bacterium]|jgi:hypothetical protein
MKNLDLSDNYWHNRYVTNDFGWDLGQVSPPLKNYFKSIQNKTIKILIPGAGNGYEAEWLFENGFNNVHILDFALAPIENFISKNPNFPKGNIHHKNFFDLEEKFDLIIEQTFFCALNPTLRENYVNKMHSIINGNGKLVGLLFHDKLNDDKPPFGGYKEEYIELFKEKFKIETMEITDLSVKPRLGRELFFEMTKNEM